jgi:uncharacterized FlaG/YvyC family protein
MSISSINPFSYQGGSSGLPEPVSADQRALLQAVRTVNASALLGPDSKLTFVRDRATQQPVIRVVSKSTGDVVAQLPSEDVLRMAEELNGGQQSIPHG